MLCHEIETSLTNRSHTKIVIRVCTDPDCHGLPDDGTVVMALDGQNVTQKLGSDSDAHSIYLDGLDGINTTYKKANQTDTSNGGNYTAGFFACLGCHTHVGVSLNETVLGGYTIYSYAINGSESIGDFYVDVNASTNYSNIENVTVLGEKPAGTDVWE
jgi:hypothetical protein